MLAKSYNLKTIAFPSISTGAYRFPVMRAACIAVGEINKFLENDESFEWVKIVCFDDFTYNSYKDAVEIDGNRRSV